jgi:hypothetical protein
MMSLQPPDMGWKEMELAEMVYVFEYECIREDYITRSFVLCTSHQIAFGLSTQEY